MKSIYIKNTIILSMCMVIVKFLGAIYRIVISNILGTTGIGLYQFVFPVYALCLVFITGAMPTYISQKIASNRFNKDKNFEQKLLSRAICICLFFETLFTILLCFGGKYISYFQKSKNSYAYIIVSLSLVFSSISSVIKGYFQGKENMIPSAISGILEQVLKLVFGLLFAIILKPLGVVYAVYGAFLGILISEILSFLYLFLTLKKTKFKFNKKYASYYDTKTMFKEFFPISLANIILPISSFVDSFLVVNVLTYNNMQLNSATSLFGIATGMIAPIINFPIMLCSSVQTAFLPRLSFKISKKEKVDEIVNGTFFFVMIFTLPCVFGILSLPSNIITVFFPSVEQVYFVMAVRYLQIFAFNIFIVSVSQMCISILNSYANFKKPLISQIVSLCLKIVLFLTLTFVFNLNILSLAIASVVSNFVGLIICVFYVKKVQKISFKTKNLVLVFVDCIFMFCIVKLLNNLFSFNIMAKTIFLVLFAVVFYFAFLILFKVVNLKQIKNILSSKSNYNTKTY